MNEKVWRKRKVDVIVLNFRSISDSVNSTSPNPTCSGDFNPNLKWAPPVFYPKGAGVTRLKKPDCKPEDRLWKNTCCRTVYFLGNYDFAPKHFNHIVRNSNDYTLMGRNRCFLATVPK